MAGICQHSRLGGQEESSIAQSTGHCAFALEGKTGTNDVKCRSSQQRYSSVFRLTQHLESEGQEESSSVQRAGHCACEPAGAKLVLESSSSPHPERESARTTSPSATDADRYRVDWIMRHGIRRRLCMPRQIWSGLRHYRSARRAELDTEHDPRARVSLDGIAADALAALGETVPERRVEQRGTDWRRPEG